MTEKKLERKRLGSWDDGLDTTSLPSDPTQLFLCPKGHVSETALSKKKKGKRHCAKLTATGHCGFPVEAVYGRSLKHLYKRAFRAGRALR